MNLKTYIRESITFTIALNDRGAAFTPGADYHLIFTAKISEQDEDIDALIQKETGAGLTHSTTNALLTLVPNDTDDISARLIVYDIRAQHLITGARKTVARGTLRLVQDIGREPVVSVPIYTTEPPSAAVRIYNSTTGTYYIMTLVGAPGAERLAWTPEA
jgi:hypothetical protein